MLLKYKEDLRTLVFLIFGSIIFLLLWIAETINFPLYFIFLLFSISICSINHNHSHIPIWKSNALNKVTDYWIIVFQGHPLFLFHPAHNINHHTYCNTKIDYNHTWKYKNRNDFIGFLTHPIISAFTLAQIIPEYLSYLFSNNKLKFLDAIFQYLFLISYLSIALLSDAIKTIIIIIIPQLVSLFYLLASNYLQHAHTNEKCQYNNSRNFTGYMNKVLFNSGFHTAHHLWPQIHWSQLPKAHENIKHKIHPKLNEKSLIGYMLNTYILAIFIKRYKSKPFQSSFV